MKSSTISIAKGICIILMVAAHAGLPLWLIRFIYMFHMPFFFIISGFCLKEKYFNDSITFFKKRVKNLYFPYVKWSFVFLLLHNFLFKLHFYDKEYGYVNRVDFSYIPQHYII